MSSSKMHTNIITSMSQGFANTYLLYTACKLNLFDLIGQGGVSAQEISENARVDLQIIYKILRPLVAYGFIIENQSRYELTEQGYLLTESENKSLKGYVLYCGGICAKCWSMMAEAAQRDVVPYQLALGMDLFVDNREDENQYAIFNSMMNFVSRSMVLSDFLKNIKKQSDIRNIIDIGGGTGAVLIQFLEYFTNASGVIVDLEFVREKALCNIKKNKLLDRCAFKTGNFFEPLEVVGDVFILSRVLHDWNDDHSVKILKNIKNVMTTESVLYIIELIIPEEVKRENLNIYMNDLQMWAVCGGAERKLSEYRKLFREVGLVCTGIQRIASGESVITVKIESEVEVGEI